MQNTTKEHYSVNNVSRVMDLVILCHLMMFYICTKFHKNISEGFSTMKQIIKFIKGHISEKKNIGLVIDLIFCTSPDNSLYMYQVS